MPTKRELAVVAPTTRRCMKAQRKQRYDQQRTGDGIGPPARRKAHEVGADRECVAVTHGARSRQTRRHARARRDPGGADNRQHIDRGRDRTADRKRGDQQQRVLIPIQRRPEPPAAQQRYDQHDAERFAGRFDDDQRKVGMPNESPEDD